MPWPCNHRWGSRRCGSMVDSVGAACTGCKVKISHVRRFFEGEETKPWPTCRTSNPQIWSQLINVFASRMTFTTRFRVFEAQTSIENAW
ncbi:hypothetical protein B0T10DRAFT_483541 [Thelonectria olida]|uniref:Uncharacterized protein n=1 Tax=Thelonectria olida TaxID=1576542 RepID=A0A9P9AU66_9HYPO|nr:hypothetical protein B0T10DRAFT_483541 [Thelonectria olida]